MKHCYTMGSKLRTYKIYSGIIKTFLVMAGVWPNYHSVVKWFISFLNVFSLFLVTVAVLNFCLHNATNVMMLTKGIGLVVTFSTSFLKICIFLLHQDDLIYINKYLSTKFSHHLKNRENHSDLLKYFGYFNCFMWAHIILAALALFISFGLPPLIALRNNSKYVRVIPAIYPISYDPAGFVQWILCTVDTLGALSVLFTNIGVDYLFGLYTLQMTGVIRILARKLNELHTVPNYIVNLRECIQMHQLLINVKKKLEKLYGLISIWMAITGAMALCALVFQVSEAAKNKKSLSHTLHILFYLLPKYLQLFAFAWNGNIIAEESGACLDSIYYSNWPEHFNKKYKNDILIILSQQPFALVAKGCMLIQYDMFTKIVKTSVSYFCLLRSLSESDVK